MKYGIYKNGSICHLLDAPFPLQIEIALSLVMSRACASVFCVSIVYLFLVSSGTLLCVCASSGLQRIGEKSVALKNSFALYLFRSNTFCVAVLSLTSPTMIPY